MRLDKNNAIMIENIIAKRVVYISWLLTSEVVVPISSKEVKRKI